MRAALLAEYRKLVSTRLWWLLLIVMVGYLVFVAAIVSASFVFTPEGTEPPLLCSGMIDEMETAPHFEAKDPDGKRYKSRIDPQFCTGCNLCAQVCKFGAISPAQERNPR